MPKFLLRWQDRVVSKAEIVAEVWDEARDPGPNLVKVCISSAHRKIDVLVHRRTVATVPSFGYQSTGRDDAKIGSSGN